MGRPRRCVVAGSGALLAVAAIALGDSARGAPTQVALRGNRFQPASVTIRTGDSVVWTSQDSAPHTVTARDTSFDSHPGCGPGGTGTCMRKDDQYTLVFTRTGTFDYFCKVHGLGMSGAVTVEAAASTTTTTTGAPSSTTPTTLRATTTTTAISSGAATPGATTTSAPEPNASATTATIPTPTTFDGFSASDVSTTTALEQARAVETARRVEDAGAGDRSLPVAGVFAAAVALLLVAGGGVKAFVAMRRPPGDR